MNTGLERVNGIEPSFYEPLPARQLPYFIFRAISSLVCGNIFRAVPR